MAARMMGQNERTDLDLIGCQGGSTDDDDASVLAWAAHWGWDPELSGQERKEDGFFHLEPFKSDSL